METSAPITCARKTAREPVALLSLVAAFIFIATTAYTIYCTHSMSGGMEMPGGWVMSMMWMPMSGQSQAGAAFMFINMWVAMMVAMMLPSAMPMILIYRRVTAFRGAPDVALRTWLMASGYFAVWALFGGIVYVFGLLLMKAAMNWTALSRAIPAASAVCLIACGIYQATPWKRACLKHCQDPLSSVANHLHSGRLGALQMGLHHGALCAACCWSLMLIQVVLGMMNLLVMAAIALIIALEKMMARGTAVAKVVGAIAIVAGCAMLIRSIHA